MVAIGVIIGLIVGFVIGLLVTSMGGRKVDTQTRQQRERDQVRSDFKEYQHQVSGHLARTADHIDSIQRQCEAVQEHIFSTAQTLYREDTSSELQPNARFVQYMNRYEQHAAPTELNEKKLKDHSGEVKPPKDYSDSKNG